MIAMLMFLRLAFMQSTKFLSLRSKISAKRGKLIANKGYYCLLFSVDFSERRQTFSEQCIFTFLAFAEQIILVRKMHGNEKSLFAISYPS